MGVCRICRVKRDSLTDGRCRSCQRVFEASQKKMTYGKYVDTLPKVPIELKAAVELPDKAYNECRFCGARIEPWQKECTQYECQIKKQNEKYEKEKARREAKKEGKEKPLIEKLCRMCGNSFLAKSERFLYCSEKCKRAAQRKRDRERRIAEELMF